MEKIPGRHVRQLLMGIAPLPFVLLKTLACFVIFIISFFGIIGN